MLSAGLFLIVGLLMLVLGGELLLRGAVALAALARLTPAVIGLTVVAVGTSVPELAVSLYASFNNQSDIAVGNVVGSNIFNIACILGVTALIRPLAISGNTVRLEYPVLALLTFVYVLLAADGQVNRLEAILFITAYIMFTAYLVRLVRKEISPREEKEFEEEVSELADEAPGKSATLGRTSLLTVSGIALLGSGATLAVNGAVGLATLLGLSQRVIGLTIVSAGTSLPELITSIVALRRGHDDVAIGNVIGSNLFNIAGILGLTALILPIPVHAGIVHGDNWWMLGLTLVLFPLMITGRRISRWEGAALLSAYIVYLVTLLLSPTESEPLAHLQFETASPTPACASPKVREIAG